MYSWRASLASSLAGAVSGVALLTLFAAGHSGRLDGETIFFMVAIALPVAALIALPIGFALLPLARILMEKAEAYTLGRLVAVGTLSGFVLPAVVAWRLRARFVTESWALTAIFLTAATIAGALGALTYHLRMRAAPTPGPDTGPDVAA